jgi:hypothetical protein
VYPEVVLQGSVDECGNYRAFMVMEYRDLDFVGR